MAKKVNVWQRNGIWYVDFMYQDQNGNRRRFKHSTGKKTTRKEAEALARTWKNEADQLGYIPGFESEDELFENQNDDKPPYPFSGFAKHFLETYVKPYNKPSEYRGKESILRVHLVPYFKNMDIRAIRREHLYKFIAEKAKSELSPKTVNNFLAVLSKMFNLAYEWDYIQTSPMKGVKKLKLPPSEFDFYDGKEMRVYLETAKRIRPDWHPFFLCAFLTGMRLGEICGLMWEDVDFLKGVIKVRHNMVHGQLVTPKSGRNREIPIHPELFAALKSHRHLKSELVFCRKDGRSLTRNSMRKPFFRVQRMAGLRRIKFHEVRHSFASQLVINNVSLKAVQELLGHADIRQTMIYAHLSPNVHHDAIATLMGGGENWDKNLSQSVVKIS